jgi:hypothetical protein
VTSINDGRRLTGSMSPGTSAPKTSHPFAGAGPADASCRATCGGGAPIAPPSRGSTESTTAGGPAPRLPVSFRRAPPREEPDSGPPDRASCWASEDSFPVRPRSAFVCFPEKNSTLAFFFGLPWAGSFSFKNFPSSVIASAGLRPLKKNSENRNCPAIGHLRDLKRCQSAGLGSGTSRPAASAAHPHRPRLAIRRRVRDAHEVSFLPAFEASKVGAPRAWRRDLELPRSLPEVPQALQSLAGIIFFIFPAGLVRPRTARFFTPIGFSL